MIPTRLEILESRHVHDTRSKMEPGSYNGANVDRNRRDQYAENLIGQGHYRDTGCNLAPSCLDCPFSECMKEWQGKTELQSNNARRNAAIWKAYKRIEASGKRPNIKALAEKHGLATRTVHRIIANAKNGKGITPLVEKPQRVDTHKFLTAGIFKARTPNPPLFMG